MIQQSATCPSVNDFGSVSGPLPCRAYVVTELAPASPTASRPVGVNVNANGTGVAEAFFTGVAESRPFGCTSNTSIALPLAFVVMITWRPSGAKPTWRGGGGG